MSDPAPGATLRCKLRVTGVTRRIEADGSPSSETVDLIAVTANSDANKDWSKWTPSANFAIVISNPDAFGALSKDHEFFVDFTPANKA